MNVRRVLRYLGIMALAVGVFMASSLYFVWRDGTPWTPWLASIGLAAGLGGLGWWYGARADRRRPQTPARYVRPGVMEQLDLTRREALAIVGLSWFVASAFGAVPFWLDGMVATPVDAFFEAASGFTTTGSSILTEIEGNHRAGLWWRSLIQWLGGMGIIVLFVAIFPQAGSAGRRLFESEAPGPVKEQLRPRVRETGLALWRIYAVLTAVLALLLRVFGMGWFDAICHALTTMATGGFSTRNASVGAFDSAAIDWTLSLFMLAAGANYGLYYAFARKRSWRAFADAEFACYLAIAGAFSVLITIDVLPRYGGDFLHALRASVFQVASITTSTGYATADFNVWPAFSRTALILLMFVGGSGGSTAGGYKVSRAMIIASIALAEVRHAIHPRAIYSARLWRQAVPDRVARQVMGLFVITVTTLLTATVLLSAGGLSLEDAFAAAMTALANSGPALGAQGAAGNFAALGDGSKLLMAWLMIVGRLEYYTVLALLLPSTWRS